MLKMSSVLKCLKKILDVVSLIIAMILCTAIIVCGIVGWLFY